tara:strand:- start:207 stop:497 length:291 start_codon:yes stop_codon:yes gene_type:complete
MRDKNHFRKGNKMKNKRTLIKKYMEYEFPQKMETEPNLIMGFVDDYENGIDSINGLLGSGVINIEGIEKGYGDETLMCYVEDRLINEKWDLEEEMI